MCEGVGGREWGRVGPRGADCSASRGGTGPPELDPTPPPPPPAPPASPRGLSALVIENAFILGPGVWREGAAAGVWACGGAGSSTDKSPSMLCIFPLPFIHAPLLRFDDIMLSKAIIPLGKLRNVVEIIFLKSMFWIHIDAPVSNWKT